MSTAIKSKAHTGVFRLKIVLSRWFTIALATVVGACALMNALSQPSFAAESTQLNLSADERRWLAENPSIKVHNESNWPPFNFYEDGHAQGLSIDYMNLLASKIGIEVNYVTGPSWSEFLGLMKNGELDVMLNIVKTPDRQKYLLYTTPYVRNPNTILSRRETPYDNLEQLFEKTVALPKGFFYEEILKREFPRIKLHLVTDVEESMKAVIFGKADAALGELAVFNYLMDKQMMSGLVLSGEVEMGSPEYEVLNIATRKDLPHLISILRKAKATITSAEVKALRQIWIGGATAQPATPKQPQLNLSASEKAWLAKHPDLRLGVDPQYPPFEFIDNNGIYSGLASDYARLISERLGIKMEVAPDLSWQQVLEGIAAKTLDVLPAVSKTPEREAMMNFTKPHMEFPFVIITRDNHPFVGGLDDFIYKEVALVEGYSSTDLVMAAYPNVFDTFVSSPLEALQSVAVGDTSATVMNLAVATYLIKQHSLNNLKVAAPTDLEQSGLAFGVRKDWPEMVGILNKALASITPEEEAAIRNRWATVRYDQGVDITLVFQVGGVGIFIFTIIVLWNRRLQREVKQRILAEQKMEEAKNEAERLTQSKSEFIAAISHEVRTPMNGVLGMARLLTEMDLDSESRTCVNTIVASGEELITIINDLLDLSKLDANRLEIEHIPFSITETVDHAMEIMQATAADKGISFSSTSDDNIPAVVIGDPHRLRQIILNLLSNAVKFTNAGSVHLVIKMGDGNADKAQVTFSVIDTGRGIEEGALKKLFSEYAQGSVEVARKYGGTGLGLAICRRLAVLMGGEITVDSTFGEGSTFHLKLPMIIGRAEDLEKFKKRSSITLTTGKAAHARHPLCVLQAEDNQTNRAVVERVLARVGHAVASVENGQQAVHQAQTGVFDVILMDRHMPVMDGLEATRQIRALDDHIASIPIIGITAGAGKDEIAACIEAGMNDCLIKPVDPRELRAILETIKPGGTMETNVRPRAISIVAEPTNGGGQPINLEQLARALDESDEAILFELLDIFNAEFPMLLGRIDAAIHAHDAKAVHHAAHAAKGAAANAAATRLTDLLREMQESATLENWDDLKARAGVVASQYDKVVQFCKIHHPGG